MTLFLNNNIQDNIKAGKLITTYAIALIFAISISILTPNISEKIIKTTDKITLFPFAKIVQKNTEFIEVNNKISDKKIKIKKLDKKAFSLYIKNNKEKLNSSFKSTNKIIIKEQDLKVIVAGISNEDDVSK